MFSRERTASDTGSVCLDDTDSLANHLGWNAETSANTANGCRRGGDVGEGSKVDIEHQRVRSLDKDLLAFRKRLVEVDDTVEHIGAQTLGKVLQTRQNVH